MNSSSSISPGCKAGINAPSFNTGLVVIDNFDLVGIAIAPSKTDSVLIVDPQAPLARPVAPELLQHIPGRLVELLNRRDRVNLSQLPKSYPLKCRKSPAVPVVKNLLGFFVDKRTDHA